MMITHVAIKLDNIVYSLPRPNRHHHVIALIKIKGVKKQTRGIQGFLTKDDRFVDRLEAAKIAVDSGQIDLLRWPPNLYSEDLW